MIDSAVSNQARAGVIAPPGLFSAAALSSVGIVPRDVALDRPVLDEMALRLTELHLQAFGRFRDQVVRWMPGLIVVYGANEAGKSTLHSFAWGMLYGFAKPGLKTRRMLPEWEAYTRGLHRVEGAAVLDQAALPRPKPLEQGVGVGALSARRTKPRGAMRSGRTSHVAVSPSMIRPLVGRLGPARGMGQPGARTRGQAAAVQRGVDRSAVQVEGYFIAADLVSRYHATDLINLRTVSDRVWHQLEQQLLEDLEEELDSPDPDAAYRERDRILGQVTRTMLERAAAVYDLACDPRTAELASAASHLTGRRINRWTHVPQNQDDLVKKAKMLRAAGQITGTCFQRCVGMDALITLHSVTFEIDKKYGTEYHKRFQRFLIATQDADLMSGGAMTDPKGDRNKRPHEQHDPDLYLRIAERRADGIVVRGAKLHQTGAVNSHQFIIMPGQGLGVADVPAEERIRLGRLIENMTGATPIIECMHGAGSPQAQKVVLQRMVDWTKKVKLARRIAMSGKTPPPVL